MEFCRKTILLLIFSSFMSVGWGQDCIDGVEVELWGECYNIEETTYLGLSGNGLTGEIPPEIGDLVNGDCLIALRILITIHPSLNHQFSNSLMISSFSGRRTRRAICSGVRP